MKNYIKISIAICLALISNNTFANQQMVLTSVPGGVATSSNTNQPLLQSTVEQTLCCFHDFLKPRNLDDYDSSQAKLIAGVFFGDSVSTMNGTLCLARTQSEGGFSISVINETNQINGSSRDLSCECVIKGSHTLFVGKQGTLAMGSGSKIHIVDQSKLLILGKLNIEPGCVINIGSCDKQNVVNGERTNGTGGYLIINADDPIDLTNVTINLWNKDSHLEIHGNDISISTSSIRKFNDAATVHMSNIPFVSEFVPNDVQNDGNDGELNPEG